MSHKLISLNADLKKLRDEGYEIEIKNSHILVHSIPYVNTQKEVKLGILVSPLGSMAGDKTTKPENHVIFFIGEYPCDKDGNIIAGIKHSTAQKTLTEGIIVDHSFSNKPPGGYSDYHHKITNYIRIIEPHAQAIDRTVNARTFKALPLDDPDSPFCYFDTNSSRAEIEAISTKLKGLKIAIVGLGGTGSYILDFIAKTPVKEIHLFDEDKMLNHNAFRTPGAISIEKLNDHSGKVAYLHDIYGQMHKCIQPHDYNLTENNLNELEDMDFVFICIDEGEIKKSIIDMLINSSIPFIDVGIGVNIEREALMGGVRVTTVTTEKNNHVENRISFADGENDIYSKNIQIAELNAINAALAVIKWKKLFGFYHDQEKEHNTTYDISLNNITNNEAIS